MSLIFNGTTVENVVYNGTALCKLVYNGTLVWENHAYGSWTTTTAATCTATGSKKRTCTRTGCGVSETATITALGHKYSLTKVDPTCTEQGYTLHECVRSGCGYSYKDSYFDATGHSYGSATYSWDGYTSCTARRACTNDSSHIQTSYATISSSITTAPTCTKTGVRTYYASFDPSDTWASKQTKTETIAATGHKSSDWIIDSEATTLGAGSKHKECTVCGTVLETATIPKLEPLTYTLLSNNTYSVKATDTNLSGAITIPSTYNGKTVTRIEDNAFKGCVTIRSVAIPNSITYIGDRAFNTCSLMNTITMSNSVTYIGSRAFAGCYSLTTGVTIPASVTTIGAYAFEGCDKLLSVTFEHTKWKAGSTSVTVTAFNGATLLKTTYASVTWTKVSTPTLVAPVFAYMSLSELMIDVEIENNNSVAVTCYFSVYDDSGAEVRNVSGIIPKNNSVIFSAGLTSSHISPFEICAYFEADGYNDSGEVYAYID